MAPRPANPPIDVNTAAAEAVPTSTKTAGFRYWPAIEKAIERCWEKAAAPSEWNLKREELTRAIQKSVAHRFAGVSPDERAIEAYLGTLQVRDLALARACSGGNAAAWDYFVAQFRPELYRAARAIAGDANSRELADSLYADLYGLRESGGQRKSLFDYFHGRSKLSSWLRAVLAQRYVDEIRRTRKTESIEDESGAETREVNAAVSAAQTRSDDLDPERSRHLAALQAALAMVLGALDPQDRLRLAYYYIDGHTLREIGRMLGEHEATVSRKIDRARRDVRQRVEAALRDDKNWTDAQVKLCFDYASGEWPFDLEESLRPSPDLKERAT